jgi:hypothetical protein
MQMKTRSEALADIAIALMGMVGIGFGWDTENRLGQLSLIWGGMCLGYLITVYMNGEEDDKV